MLTTAHADAVAVAEARAAAYALLAHGFQYPDAAWHDELRHAGRWQAWPAELERTHAGMAALAAEVQRTASADETDDARKAPSTLQAAYDALFGHAVVGRCSAYETEYGDSEINQRSAQLSDLAGFYQAFGLELASRDGDRPDSVSVECAFMSIVCAKEAHARLSGNDEWIDCCAQAQRAFLKDHLARWLPAFAQRVSEAAVSPFYDALGRFAGELLTLECARLGLPAGPRWLEMRAADPEVETTISCLDSADCGPGSSVCAPRPDSERLVPLNLDIGGT